MKNLTIEPSPAPQELKKIVSLDDLWNDYLMLKGTLSFRTADGYKHIRNKFFDFLKGRRNFDRIMMVEWSKHLQDEGLGGARINRINTVIKGFIKFLVKMGYIHDEISDIVPKAKEQPQAESKIFTEEEYEKIKAYCKGREWCQIHLWLIILAYRTGMSLVDCCHLRWCNVHLNDNGPSYIEVRRIKTERFGAGAVCHIPIIPFTDVHTWLLFLKDNVVRYPMASGINDYVQPDAPGLYACTFQRPQQDFKNIFIRAGIEPGKTKDRKSFKHLRNSFCSNLINSGAQTALICKMTGHQNMKTLLGYLKPDTRAMQEELAKAFLMASDNKNIIGSDGLTEEKE